MPSQTRHHPHVDRYSSGFAPPWCSWLGLWTGLEQNQNIVAMWTRTAGRVSGLVANSRFKCWMPLSWCCLDLQRAAGNWIQCVEWIPLLFFINNARNVIVCYNHPLLKGIPSQNGQWQLHYNFLSHQCVNHYCCNWGESLSKTHSICHQYSLHINIPYPHPQDEADGKNLVCQKLSSRQGRSWIMLAWNMVICSLINGMSIQQPDYLIKMLVFKFITDCTPNQI